MERAGDGQALGADAPPLEHHLDGIDGAGLASDHRLLGGILRAHPHLPGERLDRRSDLVTTGDHREHRPLFRSELPDRRGPGLRGAGPLREAPGAGGDERGKLPEAVAGDHIGLEAHPLEHGPGEEVRQIHPPLGVPDDRPHAVAGLPGDPGEGLEPGRPGLAVELLDGLAGHGRLRRKSAEHVGVLRSLSREERGDEGPAARGGVGPGPRRCRRDGLGGRHGGRLARRGRHGEPVVHDDMTDERLVDDGDGSGPIAARIEGRHRHGLGRCRGQPWPGQAGGRHRGHPPRREDVGKLDHPGGCGRSAEVPHERLDCAPHRPGSGLGSHRPELLLVALGGPRTGDLHGRDGPRHDPRLEPRLADHARRGVCHRCPRSDRHAADHAVDPVAGSARIGEALEHQHHRPLGGNPPRMRGVEDRTRPIGEQPLERQPLIGHQIEVALAGGKEHGIALAFPEQVDRGRQGRDAGAVTGIKRQRSTHEIERLRQPAGEGGAGEAPGLVDQRGHLLEELFAVAFDDPLDVARCDPAAAEGRAEIARGFREPEPHLEVVGELAAEHRPHDDAGPDPVERAHPADLGDGGIGRLEKHELERVGRGDLLRRDLVPPPVVDEAFDEASHAGPRPPAVGRRGIEGAGDIPAGCRNRADDRRPLAQKRPEGIDSQGAGEDAADADDRHGLIVTRSLRHRPGGGRRGGVGAMLGEGEMDIEPTDSEGVDGRPPDVPVGALRPGERLTGNDERPLLPIEVFVVVAAGRAGGDDAVLHGEHDLDQTRHAGGFEGVADVGLHAADRDLLSGREVGGNQRRQCPQFGRVADLGARGVGFDVIEATELTFVGIGSLDGEFLALLARCPQALPLAVAGHADPADDRPDPIAVGDRLGEGLDDQRDVPLSGHQAVGIAPERTGSDIADRLGGGEEDEAVRLAVRGSADDRLIDPPLLERPGRDGEGLEGRRAGGVDDEIRAVELERLANDLGGPEGSEVELLPRTAAGIIVTDRGGDLGREALDGGAEQFAGGLHLAEPGSAPVDPGGIDVVADPGAAAGVADIDAGPGLARHREGVEARVPAGQRSNLEEDVVGDVVAIEHLRADRTDGRISRTLADDRPQVGVALADLALLGVEVEVAGKAGVGQTAPGGAAMHHEVPEGLQAVGAREPACHADNRQ